MSRSSTPRPQPERQRSNSLPIVEALGCSTEEARIIMAEGRAAFLRRRPGGRDTSREAAQRRPRSLHQQEMSITTFRPEDHIHYLDPDFINSNNSSSTNVAGDSDLSEAPARDDDDEVAPSRSSSSASTTTPTSHSFHNRVNSDTSTSTITGLQSPTSASPSSPSRSSQTSFSSSSTKISPPPPAPAQLGNYSANLAMFIRSQLNSIPSYQPRDLPVRSTSLQTSSPRATLRSSSTAPKRAAPVPNIVEMPPVRPPPRSAFSAWSSTDDETDDEDDVPALPVISGSRKNSMVNQYTPSILQYYGEPTESYLLSSTPDEEELLHPFTKDFRFPVPQNDDCVPRSLPSPSMPSPNDDVPSESQEPDMTSSSGRSCSSDSSYFNRGSTRNFSRPRTRIRDKIMAAITPTHSLSPFNSQEGKPVFPPPNRVTVEGMHFDMIRA